MLLTLTLLNPDASQEGKPTELVLNRQEATIGRSPACDIPLADPDKTISSRHGKISYADGGYVFTDLSTNGTFVNGGVDRMPQEHKIADGDVFQIGRYQIRASLSDDTHLDARPSDAKTVPPSPAPPAAEAQAAPEPAPAAPEPAAPAPAPPAPAAEAPAPEPKAPAPAPAAEPAEEPSEGAYQPSAALAEMVNAGAEVDWDRGGFGGPTREATVWQPMVTPDQGGAAAGETGGAAAALPENDLDRLVAMFLDEAGLSAKDVKNASPDVVLRAGRLIKRLVAGLVVMVEARARAKGQMGAETTNLSLEGNNPIKFTRTPEQALARLLNPAERGFMEGEEAIEDAYRDLQAHQVATLKAMQGALKTALNRFSPDAIRRRAELKGIFSRILPAARDAELWQNYEREFGLVAQESDEAFVEVFAKQFRKAYEQQTLKAKEEKGG
jgi:type VI secretion system protein